MKKEITPRASRADCSFAFEGAWLVRTRRENNNCMNLSALQLHEVTTATRYRQTIRTSDATTL